jgi:hypothetical protein
MKSEPSLRAEIQYQKLRDLGALIMNWWRAQKKIEGTAKDVQQACQRSVAGILDGGTQDAEAGCTATHFHSHPS